MKKEKCSTDTVFVIINGGNEAGTTLGSTGMRVKPGGSFSPSCTLEQGKGPREALEGQHTPCTMTKWRKRAAQHLSSNSGLLPAPLAKGSPCLSNAWPSLGKPEERKIKVFPQKTSNPSWWGYRPQQATPFHKKLWLPRQQTAQHSTAERAPAKETRQGLNPPLV